VRTRACSLIGLLVLLVASAVATNAFADLRASLAAMSCCAKTNYKCAGLSAPDDCCQHMGHGAQGAAAGTISNALLLQPAVTVVLRPHADTTSTRQPLDASTFTRPHDPPHLHSYSLLI
jgi:hypothetical protein